MTFQAFVADGDKVLVFTGATQAEANRKARRYLCNDRTARGNVRW